MKIFNPLGGFSETQISQDDSAFITISKVNAGDILLARAPVTSIDIQQLTDYSLTKSLDNNFLVTTFGDTPVKIELRGINIYNLNGCQLGKTNADKTQIMSFYKKNKVSTDLEARFDLAIKGGKDEETPVFRCVIVSLRVMNNGQQQGVPTGHLLYDYTMTLIGASRT